MSPSPSLSRLTFHIFFQPASDADNRQSYDFLGLLVVSNDDPLPFIKTYRGFRLAEAQVESIGVVIVVPIQRHIFF